MQTLPDRVMRGWELPPGQAVVGCQMGQREF